MIKALLLFVLTYIFMLALPKRRPLVVVISAIIFIGTGVISFENILPSIDFNVLLMIAGTMGTVFLLIDSKMPSLLADIIVEKVPNVKWAIITLSLFAGIVSAFIDNVATVLMIAPIALEISKKLKINPVGMIIAIAVSSNLQGAATLVGDTTSILLGGYAGMNFMDFFVYHGRPGIFFAVELGALVSASLLLIIFKKEDQAVRVSERTVVTDYVPSVLMVLTVVLLIIASFIPGTPYMINGIICFSIMLIGMIYYGIKKRSFKAFLAPVKEIDFETIVMLAGLFVIVGAITEAGVIDAIASVFAKIGKGNIILVYTLTVWFSVVISAFVDNIPYVATMLPVVRALSLAMNADPTIFYFGLLCGATLGGNLTPVGASANITGIGILKREGFEVKNSDFMRIGVPFTLAAVIPAYIYFMIFYL